MKQSMSQSQMNGPIPTVDSSQLENPPRNPTTFSTIPKTRTSFAGRGNTNGNIPRDDSSSVHSRSKENSYHRGTGGRVSDNGDGGDNDWVTDSGLGIDTGSIASGDAKQINSFQRSDSASTISGRVGNVRKRLSLLKLGKKASKSSVLVDSVAEED